MPKSIIILIICPLVGYAASGLDLTWGLPYRGAAPDNLGIINISYFLLNPRIKGFSEMGMVGMPSTGIDPPASSKGEQITSFAGLYGGHLFLSFGAYIRPGFHLGTIFEERIIPQFAINSSGEFVHTGKYRTDSGFKPYFGFKLHVLFLTLLLSNKGYGAGLNLTL